MSCGKYKTIIKKPESTKCSNGSSTKRRRLEFVECKPNTTGEAVVGCSSKQAQLKPAEERKVAMDMSILYEDHQVKEDIVVGPEKLYDDKPQVTVPPAAHDDGEVDDDPIIKMEVNYGSDDEDNEEAPLPRALVDFPCPMEDIDEVVEVEVEYVEAPLLPSLPGAEGVVEPWSMFAFVWKDFPNPPLSSVQRRESFSQSNCGPTAPMPTPYDAFVAIWDRPIMEYIAAETNKYAQYATALLLDKGELGPSSRSTSWTNTDVDELYVFFGLILTTGMCIKGDMKEYWSKEDIPIETPKFATYMTRDRFGLLSRFLHFADNEVDISKLSRPEAKIYKVAPIVDHLNRKFQELYRLGRNIALDESLTQWKGWLNINQFMPKKAASVGIKTYEVCESATGYLWRFEVYAGRDEDASPQEPSPVSGVTPRLVLHLLRGLENVGHTVWMDNYFNSPALARMLKALGIDCVGTLRLNRQLVPPELSTLTKNQMVIGQVYGATSGDVDVVLWRDQNRVAMISTYHGNSVNTRDGKSKPVVIQDYNVCMGGVDKKDQMLASYPIERKRTKVWYKKFFKRLLNVSVLNSLILHRRSSLPKGVVKVYAHRDFRKSLIHDLLTRHNMRRADRLTPPSPSFISPSKVPLLLKHLPAEYECFENTNIRRRRRCTVCHTRTSCYCSGCQVPLCVYKCFGPYHSRK